MSFSIRLRVWDEQTDRQECLSVDHWHLIDSYGENDSVHIGTSGLDISVAEPVMCDHLRP